MSLKRKIRIDQFLAGFSPHDAISNEALIMQKIIRELGFVSEIFAEHLHPHTNGAAKRHYEYCNDNSWENIAIFHFSIGCAITTFLAYKRVKIVLRYHNVTPPEFFTLPSDHISYHVAMLGRKQIPILNQMAICVLADSEYNLKDFSSKIGRPEEVLPILRDYTTLMNLEDDPILKSYMAKDQKNRWLFVGRIAPNKAQHDIITMLKIFQEIAPMKTGLTLIGSFFSTDYKNMLTTLCSSLGLTFAIGCAHETPQVDVLFIPDASDHTLKTAYKNSDLFLCLSDHEGFCVPIVEASAAGLPVIAHKSSAITETGRQCTLINKHDKLETMTALIAASQKKITAGGADNRSDLKLNSKRFSEIISKIASEIENQ